MARKSAKAGVEYIVVAVGDKMDDEELRIITGSNPNHIFKLDTFDELDRIVADVAVQVCESKYCKCGFS